MALPSNNKRKIFDGRYEVISIVGRGSDSVVYHARHAGSPTQEVALKVLVSQKEKNLIVERLRKEALTLVSCRHRYVVRLDDFHSIGDLCYLSMEYAPEGDLRKFINKRKEPLSPALGERFLRQSLEALDFVHATGVLHRDVKPDNILVMNEREIRLADFGLALLPGEDPSLEDLQSGVGSFGYLPPEVLEGVAFDQRSDLYALGLCFYEMIAGTHPFESASMIDQLEIRQDSKLKPLSSLVNGVSQHLNTIVMKLLRYSPEDRFASALEALKAINDPDYVEVKASNKSPKTAAAATSAAVPIEQPAFTSSDSDIIGDDDSDELDKIFESILADETPDEKIASVANSDTPATQAVTSGVREQTTSIVDEPITTSSDGSAALAAAEPESNDEANVEEASVSEPPVNSAERVPQLTEKIDLERIKEIIAKDAQQKADAARRRATQSQNLGSRGKDVGRTSATGIRQRANSTGDVNSIAPKAGLVGAGLEAFSKIPHALRPVVVGLAAAVVTVVVVAALQLFSFGRGDVGDTETEQVAAVEQSAQDSGTSESESTQHTGSPIESTSSELPADTVFPKLPGGLFAGNISGVLPGVNAPFTLISLPKQGMVAVVVGIEGWSPVMVPSTNSGGEPIQPLVVRSNGMILNINGMVGAGIIEGTFANAVTGETGTWQVKKVS